MAKEQEFMNGLYTTIIKSTDFYNADAPYCDLENMSSKDLETIYNCIDEKTDVILEFITEYFIPNKSKQALISNIHEIEELIESPTWEDAFLSLAQHLDKVYLDESYSDLLSYLGGCCRFVP